MFLPNDLNPLYEQLTHHRLYPLLNTPQAVRSFMSQHVFCVWDFQVLVRALTRRLAGESWFYTPTAYPQALRLLNQITVGEETDETPQQTFASHFSLYVQAMEACGAPTQDLQTWITSLRHLETHESLERVLHDCPAAPAARAFVEFTLRTARDGSLPALAGLLCWSRENLIPQMFTQVIAAWAGARPSQWHLLHYYLQRHIELDGDDHGPASQKAMEEICRTPFDYNQAFQAAQHALNLRLNLWDAIACTIQDQTQSAV